MKILKTHKENSIVFLSGLALLFILFPKLFLNNNELYLGAGGDGLKNYFTFIYYILFDSSHHFTGMNYPYGEHVLYTDNQFGLAFLLNKLNFTNSRSLFNLLNVITLLSFPIGILVVYKILRRYKIPFLYAWLFSILIIFQSPQASRFTSHYSLFYLYFIPLCWLNIMNYYDKNKAIYLAILFILGLFFSFIHLYYLLIFGVLISLSVLTHFLVDKNDLKHKLTIGGQLFILPLLIAGLVLFFQKSTDLITDRVSPFGADTYKSHILHLFLPMKGTVRDLLSSLGYFKYPVHSEGDNYLGLIMVLALIVFLIYLFKKSKWKLNFELDSIQVIIIVGALSFLIALGLHNKLFGDLIQKTIPKLSQFRSLTRVGWITYYLLAIGLSVFLYSLLQKAKEKLNSTFFYIIISFIVVVWSFEAYQRIQDGVYRIRTKSMYGYSILENSDFENFAAKNLTDKYQAALYLPYFSAGSEKFSIENNHALIYATLPTLNTGIPMMNGFLSRSSISQKMNQLQLFSHPLIHKEIVGDLNKKPIAVVVIEEGNLNQNEIDLIQKCKLVDSIDGIMFYSLDPSSLKVNYEGLISDSTTYVYKDIVPNSFLNSNMKAQSIDKMSLEIFNEKLPFHGDSIDLELSFWLQVDTLMYGMPKVILAKYVQNELAETQNFFTNKNCFDFYKGWLRVSIPIVMHEKELKLKVRLEGFNLNVDELIIKPRDRNVVIKNSTGQKTFNNYPIKDIAPSF